MKKRILALLLAGSLLLGLAACDSSSNSRTNNNDATEAPATPAEPAEASAEAPAETYKVGICQLVQHVALDAATEGFIDALPCKK